MAENLYLGREPLNGFGLIDWPMLREESRKHLAALQQSIDPGVRVGRLRVGQQQMVEIARALSLNARLIIMDEPTDALTDVETDILHDAIRRLRDQGKGIVYISHRLSEIFKICDSVTVLRDGRTAAAEPNSAVSEAELIHTWWVARSPINTHLRLLLTDPSAYDGQRVPAQPYMPHRIARPL